MRKIQRRAQNFSERFHRSQWELFENLTRNFRQFGSHTARPVKSNDDRSPLIVLYSDYLEAIIKALQSSFITIF